MWSVKKRTNTRSRPLNDTKDGHIEDENNKERVRRTAPRRRSGRLTITMTLWGIKKNSAV